MSWLALHRSKSCELLIQRHPKAFLLLTVIAIRARYTEDQCPITGLGYGQAFIGDWQDCGLESYKGYRIAKNTLTELGFAAFKGTSRGTIATLLPRDGESMIYTISNGCSGQAEGQTEGQSRGNQGAIKGPLTTRKQGNKEKKEKAPLPPECYRFADWFAKLLPEGHKLPDQWQSKFAKSYDELTQIDKRTKEEIRDVCLFGTQDSFWKDHFTMPGYLRNTSKKTGQKQFDQIHSAMMRAKATETPKKPDLINSKL